jgi:hypothetical protein
MKHRISKKALSQMPADVAEMIRVVGADYGIKSFEYEQKPAGYTVYHAEGARYYYVYAGDTLKVEMVSESTVGASGVRHEIGAKVQPPTGTTVITVSYYRDYYMSVVNISESALSAAA